MTRDLLMAPLVVAQRLPLLWLEMSGLKRGSGEGQRMVTEKMAAVVEGTMAAHVELQRLWWESALAPLRGSLPPGPVAGSRRLAQAALRPAAKRVRHNVKRLSRR